MGITNISLYYLLLFVTLIPNFTASQVLFQVSMTAHRHHICIYTYMHNIFSDHRSFLPNKVYMINFLSGLLVVLRDSTGSHGRRMEDGTTSSQPRFLTWPMLGLLMFGSLRLLSLFQKVCLH
jgi:hypothetical protein